MDEETRAVTTAQNDYVYNEKSLLKETNIGEFGYGVRVKIGSDFDTLRPTNYNYLQDAY